MLALFDLLCFLRLGALTRFIPITDVRGFPHNLSPAQRREWAVMDTFDAFSPEYDNPQGAGCGAYVHQPWLRGFPCRLSHLSSWCLNGCAGY